MGERNRQLCRDLAIVLGLTALMLLSVTLAHGAPSAVDTVRLHDAVEASAPGSGVLLSDVAEVEGPNAAVYGSLVVGRFGADGAALTVTRDQVRALLTDAGANWGRVTLTGYVACKVTPISPPTAEAQVDRHPAAASNTLEPVTVDSALTLREQVVRFIERFAQASRADLRIVFSDKDEPVLARLAVRDRYEFEPLSSSARGRLPLVVRRYVGDRQAETFNLTVDVSRRYLAVVATQGLSRGQTVAPGDVEIREVLLDDVRGRPVTELNQVIGQVASAQLRPGAVLFARDLRSAPMVRRGDLVTVHCVSGSLVVRTVARAEGDAAEGELVQVRNTRSRAPLTIRVTGLREGQAVAGSTPELEDAS